MPLPQVGGESDLVATRGVRSAMAPAPDESAQGSRFEVLTLVSDWHMLAGTRDIRPCGEGVTPLHEATVPAAAARCSLARHISADSRMRSRRLGHARKAAESVQSLHASPSRETRRVVWFRIDWTAMVAARDCVCD